MATDVVCGMDVASGLSSTSAVLDGEVFYFCSASCQAAFGLAPAEYVSLARALPAKLGRIRELTRNLWWSWHPEARALFQALDGGYAEPVGNPLALLLTLGRETLRARSEDANV